MPFYKVAGFHRIGLLYPFESVNNVSSYKCMTIISPGKLCCVLMKRLFVCFSLRKSLFFSFTLSIFFPFFITPFDGVNDILFDIVSCR